MVNDTEEKSLVIVNNNFFTKVKRFWFKIFNRNKVEEENYEQVNDTKFEIEEDNSFAQETKTKKLFDFDAEYDENESQKIQAINPIGTSGNIVSEVQENSNVTPINQQGGDTVYKTVEVDGNGEDTNITYLFEKKKPASVSEEREELERKLMNYYESIKPGI